MATFPLPHRLSPLTYTQHLDGVVPVTVTGISAPIGPTTLQEGQNGTYSITVTYSDGSTASLTNGVTWPGNMPTGTLTVPLNSMVGDGFTFSLTASYQGFTSSLEVSIVDTTIPVNPVPAGEIDYYPLAYRYAYQTGTWGNGTIPAFFDGNLSGEALPAYSASMTPDGDIVHTFPPGGSMTEIGAYDGAGSAAGNAQVPVGIYFKEVGEPEEYLGTFTGEAYFQWIDYPLPRTIEPEWIRWHSSQPTALWPIEKRYKGDLNGFTLPVYTRPASKLTEHHYINTYPYNSDNAGFFPTLSEFRGPRFYVPLYELENGDGEYRFGPSWNTNWDRTLKDWADLGKHALFVFNNNTGINRQTFRDNYIPPPGVSAEDIGTNAMWPYGLDKTLPETHRNLSELVHQTILRYGNVVHDPSVVNISQTPRWTGDGVQPLVTGLGYLKTVFIGNELLKTWKQVEGRATVKELATMLAVCWDGYNNTMGSGVGIKSADPSIKVGIGGLYQLDPGFFLELNFHLGTIYGFDSQGRSLWSPHIAEVHDYPRHGTTSEGIPFELSGRGEAFAAIQDVLARVAPGTELWETEFGYTSAPEASGFGVSGFVQNYSYVPAKNGLTDAERRAAFCLGDTLFKARYGVIRTYLYDDLNHAPVTAGEPIQWDFVAGFAGTITQTWYVQLEDAFPDYTLSTFTNSSLTLTTPFTNTYTSPGLGDVVAVWAHDGVTTPISVPLPNGGTRYTFSPTGSQMSTTTLNPGTTSITPSELPQFILVTP